MSKELKKRSIVAFCSIASWYVAKAHDSKDTSPAVIIGGLVGWVMADVFVEEKPTSKKTKSLL